MNIYFKCLLSFGLAALCFYVGNSLVGNADKKLLAYFVYGVGLLNIYIGVRDLAFILKRKK